HLEIEILGSIKLSDIYDRHPLLILSYNLFGGNGIPHPNSSSLSGRRVTQAIVPVDKVTDIIRSGWNIVQEDQLLNFVACRIVAVIDTFTVFSKQDLFRFIEMVVGHQGDALV